jgi:hypothetical protein
VWIRSYNDADHCTDVRIFSRLCFWYSLAPVIDFDALLWCVYLSTDVGLVSVRLNMTLSYILCVIVGCCLMKFRSCTALKKISCDNMSEY